MRDSVRVAAISIDAKPGQRDENLARIEQATIRAKESNAELILFPELSLSGFVPNHPETNHDSWLRNALAAVVRMAEPLDGDGVRGLLEISRRHGVFLAAGLVEDGGNRVFNTQVLVGPDALAGHWRKMHIPMYEMPFFCGGGGPMVADTPLGRIGVNICFDALLPESTRLLAVQNVELVLFPFAADPPPVTPQGWADWAVPALTARCVENSVYGAACNYLGHVAFAGGEQNFPGGGVILDPRGRPLAAPSDARHGMLIVELQRQVLQDARSEPEYLFRFRRPELYGPLTRA